MAVLICHIPIHREVLQIPGLLEEPILQLGFQTIQKAGRRRGAPWREEALPADFSYPDLKQMLQARGLGDVKSLDYFDPRSELRYDLNLPVPEHEHERYQTVFDIGTIEHVFDTRQCLESCLRMVKVGGYYVLQTPVKGFSGHGLHTFHPQVMVRALTLNGFEIVYLRFTSMVGEPLEHANEAESSLIWVVGRKTASIAEFKIPQQDDWGDYYEERLRAVQEKG